MNAVLVGGGDPLQRLSMRLDGRLAPLARPEDFRERVTKDRLRCDGNSLQSSAHRRGKPQFAIRGPEHRRHVPHYGAEPGIDAVPFLLGLLQAQQRLDRRHQLAWIAAVDQVPVGARLQPVHPVLPRREVGRPVQDEDRTGSGVLFQPTAHFVAVDARQPDIQHDQVGAVLCEAERLFARTGLPDAVACSAEDAGNGVAGTFVVVDVQDCGGVGGQHLKTRQRMLPRKAVNRRYGSISAAEG